MTDKHDIDIERAVTDLAAVQAAANHSPFDVRITFEQGIDGLPHASSVEAIRGAAED